MSTGGGVNTLDGSTSAENVYFGENKFRNLDGWDREAITTDGGNGYFYGHVKQIGSTILALTSWIEGDGRKRLIWAGAGLFVLGGPGMGQYARIASFDPASATVTLERPLLVSPSADSIVTVVPLQQNFIFFKNTFEDAGVAIQYYGTSVDHIAAENISVRTGGFYNSGRWYHHYQPTWYCQFFHNKISEANFYRGGANNAVESGEAIIGTLGLQKAPNTAPLALATIHRMNEVGDQGTFLFQGVSSTAPGINGLIVEVAPEFLARIKTDDGVANLVVKAIAPEKVPPRGSSAAIASPSDLRW
jgi:hypothetical protein